MGQDSLLRTSGTTRGAPMVSENKFTKIQVIFVCVVFTSPLVLYLGTKVYDTYPSGVGKSYPHFLYSYLGVGSEGGNRDEKTDTPTAVCSSSTRVEFLHDACQSLNKDDQNSLSHRRGIYKYILSDDENRMLFCDAPKTGSSFFKDLWLNYTRDVHTGDSVHNRRFLRKHGLRYLSTYNDSEIQVRLRTHYKFMVTRHPLVRLLSVYREKLERPNEHYRRVFGQFIEQRYEHVTANQSKGDHVTFEQFVHYIVEGNPFKSDYHWKPVTSLCHPCEIPYDYIVKLETSHVDYPYIFSKLKNIPDSKKGLLETVRTYKAATDLDRVKKYYQGVPVNYTNILETIYRLDFALFGYTWVHTSLSYGCRVTTYGKECC